MPILLHSTYAQIIACFLICLCAGIIQLEAQTVRLEGTVIDSTTAPLIAATVVLVQPIDSVMVSFAITDTKGNFVLNRISEGEYLLQITYIGYGNYQQRITVGATQSIQHLGTLFLSPQNTLLEQVVVKAEHVPIVIKKDTVEYNADAFKTKPNAVVEDLLKRLPGVEVERDGNIKAQGEDVENVLVDGKEFFGKDPKIATQNLPADVVDKVQVYDKKSEMAEFSGIEDGNDEKTINLSLKDGKKKGYFGQIKGGLGSEQAKQIFKDNRYEGKLSINRFDNKLQLSLLGMANNINDQGFSFNDYINFMGGMGNFMSGGKMALSLNSSDAGLPMSYSTSPGINTTAAGGLNFNYDFNENIEWQSSYFANRLNNHTLRNSSSQNLTGVSSFDRLEDSDLNNTNLNHRLNTSLRIKLDSNLQFTWINRVSFNTGDYHSFSESQTFSLDQTLENRSVNMYDNEGEQFNWFTDLTLRKRLDRPGRILSGNVNLSLGDVSNQDWVDNGTYIFHDFGPDEMHSLLQEQNSDENQLQYRFQLSFTEPIYKNTYLGLSGSRSNYVNDRIKNYYDIDPADPSSRNFNPLLSNQYRRDYSYNRLGSDLKINRELYNMTISLSYQHSVLEGDILSENISLSKSYNYLLPGLRFSYDFSNSKRVDFFYRTRVQEPSLEQLQPLLDNTDPLYLYEGNPELNPEYAHEANIHLMIFDQFSFTNFFANLNSTFTKNKIVNKTHIDDQFRQIVQPINVTSDWNTSLYTNFSTPLRFMKSKISLDMSINYNRGILFVNDLQNNTDRWTNNFTLVLENRKKKWIDAALGISLGTSRVKYSESPEFNQNYFDQTYFTDLNLFLPRGWSLESSFDYTKYSGESFATQDDFPLWKGSISKAFMADEKLTCQLSIFDILNKNQGINRSNSANYIQEVRTNVLGRYVMLSFNYKLAQFGGDMLTIEGSRR